jgi:acyl-coenzyme A thioesterase PaaI-like protein
MSVQALVNALRTVPYLAALGITVEHARPGRVRLALPSHGAILDHSGAIHPSALFGLGEAAAGVAIGTCPELATTVRLQKACGIKFLARATGPVLAEAALGDAWLAALRERLAADGRAEVDVIVPIRDTRGAEVAEVVAVYTIRTAG